MGKNNNSQVSEAVRITPWSSATPGTLGNVPQTDSPTRSYHRNKISHDLGPKNWVGPSSKFLDETFQVFWSYVAFPTQMLRTTDGQADAHGDDLSILYGAGRCVLRNGCFFQSWKKMGFPKIWGVVTAFVLFKMQKKRGVWLKQRVFSSLLFLDVDFCHVEN